MKGKDPDRTIIKSSERFNENCNTVENGSLFYVKRRNTKEEQFKEFWMQLDNKLRFRLAKNTYEKRMVIMFDNVNIHKTKLDKQLIKNLNE